MKQFEWRGAKGNNPNATFVISSNTIQCDFDWNIEFMFALLLLSYL